MFWRHKLLFKKMCNHVNAMSWSTHKNKCIYTWFSRFTLTKIKNICRKKVKTWIRTMWNKSGFIGSLLIIWRCVHRHCLIFMRFRQHLHCVVHITPKLEKDTCWHIGKTKWKKEWWALGYGSTLGLSSLWQTIIIS